MTLIKGSLGNGLERSLRVDKMTHSLLAIDYAHHEIHDGSHYEVAVSDQLSSIGQHVDISLATPGWTPTKSDDYDVTYHILYQFWSSAGHSFGIYEDVTTVSGGTVQTPLNNNRISGNTSALYCTAGSLTRTGGTLLLPLRYYGSKQEGSAQGREEELILKPSSKYVFSLTQTVQAASSVGMHIAWYETTPKH